MTWDEFLKAGRAERHRTSKLELDGIRAVARRNLADAVAVVISADTRFACAYEAALGLATMAIACAGYRVKGPGHHMTTFEALPLAMEGKETAEDAEYFNACRRLRNELSMEGGGDAMNPKTTAHEFESFTPEELLGALNDIEKKSAPARLVVAGDMYARWRWMVLTNERL